MGAKQQIRNLLNFLHLDLTKNLKYDRLTEAIITKVLNEESVCIDVGAHKGEILDLILAKSPNQKHYAFEPIPTFHKNLKENYASKCHVYGCALSNEEGETTFQFVKNAPAYSGIKKRKYDIDNPEIEEINVELKRLDDLIPATTKIDLIKIDVEGAELLVMKGAKELIKKQKPVIIFECGLGASDFYGDKAENIYEFISSELGLNISTLKSFNSNEEALNKNAFCAHYNDNSEYYFVAHA